MAGLQDHFSKGKALEAAGDFAAAETIYASLTDDQRVGVRARRRRAECLMRLQCWREAAAEVEAVFAGLGSAELPNNRDVKRWLSIRAQNGGPAVPADPVTTFALGARGAGCYPAGPFILFTAAAPKTGSTSLSVALAAALGAAKINYLDLPPTATNWGMPWWPAVDALRGCAIVNHCHLSPDPRTLEQCASRPWVKVAVHFRNPVETIESTVDMMIRQRSPNLLSAEPQLAQAPDEALRRFGLTTYLDKLARWMGDWLAVVDAGHPAVVGLSTMDEMRRDGQDAVARRLVSALPDTSVVKAGTAPQRTGKRLSGDRLVRLSENEIAQVRAAMPPEVLERFGWL